MKSCTNSHVRYQMLPSYETRAVATRPKRMREANSRELLRLLRQHMPCSRADLVRLSGLTAPTVSFAIETLERRGLVSFIGSGTPNGGRPPNLLEFNSRHGYVFGADIGGSLVRLALADLSGTIIDRWSATIRSDRTPDGVTDALATGIKSLRQQHNIPAKRVLELVAGAPGITDLENGRVLSAPNLVNWNDVPLRNLLQEKTSISTTVENDVNLAAIGESWCGAAVKASNFVFIAIGTGVGAGIVVNGQLHHGSSWSAGEMGYLMLPGLQCSPLAVNRLGALESVIGGGGIEKAWMATCKCRGNHARSPKATDIFELGTAGDRCAQQILDTTAEHLAVAITNMSLVLDMTLVVLGGGIGGHAALLEATRTAVARNEFACPEIVPSHLGGDAQLYGAVCLSLQAAEAHGFHRQLGERSSTQSLIASGVS